MGDVVHKMGARTGWTRGVVDRTCVHYRFPRVADGVLLCQTSVAGVADEGDSGSPVFTVIDDQTVALEGILWGGGGGLYGFSRLRFVELELGSLMLLPSREEPETPRAPDLVPEPSGTLGGPTDYCRLSSGGELVVRVRNPTSFDNFVWTETAVVFPGATEPEVTYLETAPMPAGSFVDVAVAVPQTCLTGGCDFLVAVDASHDLDERHGRSTDEHELNNVVRGRCVF
jgi:hypothetical protein